MSTTAFNFCKDATMFGWFVTQKGNCQCSSLRSDTAETVTCTLRQAPHEKTHHSSTQLCMPSHCTSDTGKNWKVWLGSAPYHLYSAVLAHLDYHLLRPLKDHDRPELWKWWEPRTPCIHSCKILKHFHHSGIFKLVQHWQKCLDSCGGFME